VALSELTFRDATREDLPALVALLANDPLGSLREDPHDLASYERALAEIDADPNHQVLVAVSGGSVAGMLQLSFLPHLTYEGGWRAQIEGVRVAAHLRSEGLGRHLVSEALGRARKRGCHLVQLTTDRTRSDALRFYEGLGFEATHHGLKLHLDRGTA
jgi:ribosomal protein S18 acetylase RimI-like enzyme